MTQPSTISEQQANEITLLVSQSSPYKVTSQHLKQIQQSLQTRNKKTQVYTWTVAALLRQYQRRLCEDRLLAEKHDKEWTRLKQHGQHLEHDITNYTQQIQAHEELLQTVRVHAQQRQTKYHTRQRQFHRYAKIPIIRTTYKKKYLRAQNKNQQAESDVAAQRHGIDHIKELRTTLVQRLQQQKQEQDQLGLTVGDIRDRMVKYETWMIRWNEGLAFWTGRMARISQALDQAITHLHHPPPPPRSDQQLDAFRKLCIDYQQTETYGEDQHWRLEKIDFDCAKCMQHVHQDQPRPDKNKPTDILCTPCYQGARTSMIIKKKLGFLHSTTTSSASVSSTSTSSTSRKSSFVNDPSPIPPPKDLPLNHVV